MNFDKHTFEKIYETCILWNNYNFLCSGSALKTVALYLGGPGKSQENQQFQN